MSKKKTQKDINKPIPFTLAKQPTQAPTPAEVLADYNAKHPDGDTRTIDDEPTVIMSGLTHNAAVERLVGLAKHISARQDDHPELHDIHHDIVAGRALVACIGDAADPEAPLDFALNIWLHATPAGTWDIIDFGRGSGRYPWLLGVGGMSV